MKRAAAKGECDKEYSAGSRWGGGQCRHEKIGVIRQPR